MYISSVSFLFPTVPSARSAAPLPPATGEEDRQRGRGSKGPPLLDTRQSFMWDGVLTERVGPQNMEMFEKGRVVEGKKERERRRPRRRNPVTFWIILRTFFQRQKNHMVCEAPTLCHLKMSHP